MKLLCSIEDSMAFNSLASIRRRLFGQSQLYNQRNSICSKSVVANIGRKYPSIGYPCLSAIVGPTASQQYGRRFGAGL
uniref:Uncharacterized protein n=1 Tax=Anopheles albimanus TaxID=7167 RepID=A0A182FWM4_ANOAL